MLLQDYNPMAMSILMLILISLVIFSISIFMIYLSDGLQIITYKILISLESFAPGFLFLLILFFIQLETFASYFISAFIIAIIIQVVSAIILGRYTYKKIDYPEIDQILSHEKGKSLLQVKDLKVYYPLLKGMLKRQVGLVKAVDGVSFEIKTGETIGLVGESGCGKTTVAKAILGFVDIEDGKIQYGDEDISTKFPMELRRKIQIVFQDPDASLNPRMKVVNIIAEALKNLMGITDKTEVRRFVLSLMDQVSLKREHMDRYPHEFSGGQKQRIVIARALACNPELIILDEPTSALDVSVQAQILNLLKDLQEGYGYGFLFITHDLSVVNHIADRVAVMYLGKFVEFGSTEQIFSNPVHPYTRALLSSRAEFDPDDQDIRFVIDGEVPSPINPPSGCAFNPRCTAETRTEECENLFPHKMEIEDGHFIWCCNEMLSKYHLKSTTN